MRKNPFEEDKLAEDGHPCEAALEFRRLLVRHEITADLSLDALDMAICFAWIGKAISRTKALSKWLAVGIDPNTHEIIRAMASGHEIRIAALDDCVNGISQPGRISELREMKNSQGFKHALAVVRSIATKNPNLQDVVRLGELAELAAQLPGEVPVGIKKFEKDNVVQFPARRFGLHKKR